MSLLPLFEWMDRTSLAQAIHESVWAFAAAETVHLLFLALLGGVVLLVHLRVLGQGLSQQPLSTVVAETNRLFWIGLAGSVLSGGVMVVGEALKCYHHPAFRLKMIAFAAALIASAVVQRRAARPEGGSQLLAVFSLAAWFTTGFAGRAIGFL